MAAHSHQAEQAHLNLSATLHNCPVASLCLILVLFLFSHLPVFFVPSHSEHPRRHHSLRPLPPLGSLLIYTWHSASGHSLRICGTRCSWLSSRYSDKMTECVSVHVCRFHTIWACNYVLISVIESEMHTCLVASEEQCNFNLYYYEN